MYRTILMTIAMLTTVLSVCANAATSDHGRTLIVQLQGRAIGQTRTIPPMDPTKTSSEGNCFDVDLTDVMTDNSIGTATRCFTDVKPGNGGTVLTDTTFFRLREGTIVSRSQTTVMPAFDSSPDVVHIAAAIPAPSATTILPDAGSGVFRGAPGTTRLAGAMDTSQFRARNEIGFNDIYIIKLAGRPERLAERPAALMDSHTRIRQAQRQLQEEGFAPGRIDGVLGSQTRVALQQYQAKRGLPRTGELDEATSRALGIY
jgi:putative peptidoglycan binding protein